jgi:hemoglobin
MRSAHAHLGVTAADWDATVGHLVATLQSLGVPDDLIGEIGQRILPLRDQIVTA